MSEAAFIQGRRLYEGGVYFKVIFLMITDYNHVNSFVNTMLTVNSSNASPYLFIQNRNGLNGVDYKVVPSVFL